MSEIGDDRYAEYVGGIDAWLCGGGLRSYSMFRPYETLVDLHSARGGVHTAQLYGDDATSRPARYPEGLDAINIRPDGAVDVTPQSEVARFWSWTYLTDGAFDECEEMSRSYAIPTLRRTKSLRVHWYRVRAAGTSLSSS